MVYVKCKQIIELEQLSIDIIDIIYFRTRKHIITMKTEYITNHRNQQY